MRVLLLPGYTQNKHIFSAKLGAVRKSIAKDVHLVFIDPPLVVHLPTTDSAQFDSTAGESLDPHDTPRAWWFAQADEGRRIFTQYEETIVYLRKILETEEPFDGVWGFSQGAAMAAILTALVEKPHLHPEFARPGPNWPPKPFKFSIIGSGFLPLDPRCDTLFATPLATPSLHIIGRADTIVGFERSGPLIEAFANPRVEYHDGGHHTPSKLSWRTFFREYLDSYKPDSLALRPGGGPEIASPYGSVIDVDEKL